MSISLLEEMEKKFQQPNFSCVEMSLKNKLKK